MTFIKLAFTTCFFFLSTISANAQEGFKYKVLHQYDRNMINGKWESWSDVTSDLPRGTILYISTDTITFFTQTGYKTFRITEKGTQKIDPSIMYYEVYECTDPKKRLCYVEHIMKYGPGKEITLLISYPNVVEMKFSLEVGF